jgi:uncharacterized phage infection (PIP) family protein YhgE
MSGRTTVTAYRWLVILMALAAVGGWGSFFFTSQQEASLYEARRQQAREVRDERQKLEQALKEQRDGAAELKDAEARLTTARDNLARTSEAQEQAKAALAASQSELASRRAELSSLNQQIAGAREQQTKQEEAAQQTGTVAPRQRLKRHRYASRRAKRRR